MIISVNWLKKYTDINLPIDELADRIGSRLVEIEEVIDLGKKYEGVIVAKVIECNPIENTDHLNVTKIDDGGVAKGVERDENGYVQVVCGAPNVRQGLTVAWLPPSSTVPETFGKDPFVLGSRELRGVMSNGMLASAKELDLFEDHTGILELDDDKKAGERFADAYELNDYLLDIENKSLTHRPDTFGIIGFAREVAGIQGHAFKTPERMTLTGTTWPEKTGDLPTPSVTIDDPELSRRYQAIVLTNVDCKIQLHPLEIQTYLARVGVRPHSAVVDVTNYIMMITGQPLHAFDYDKLKALNNGQIDIHVRSGRAGEKLVLLDGREIELSDNDIVIANGDTAVALAGAMGGQSTEIDETTTNVLLESASFNLYNLRNTQMRHGIFSEAITRFTKGQSAELTAPALAAAVDLIRLAATADVASDVADTYPGKTDPESVPVSAEEINEVLGTKIPTETIVNTLRNVEFDVAINDDDTINVTPPYWRTDIHIAEDVIEEVGRLNGFDTIQPTLPKRDFSAVSPDSFDQFRSEIRKILARAGANEVLSYSFVHGNLFEKSGQNVKNAYKIVNSLSPDLQYYRLTLTPSLLSLVHPNYKAGYDQFALFEMNKTHSKIFGMDDDGTPKETDLLALTVRSSTDGGSPYYQARKILDYLANSLQLTFVYSVIDADPGYDESAPFDYRRSAMVTDKATGEYIGIIGEYKASVKKAFKLGDTIAGFELDPASLHQAAQAVGVTYQPISRYPSTERDVCFQVASGVSYAEIHTAAQVIQSDDAVVTILPLDIYQPENSDVKNITLRFSLTPYQKTLSSEEANAVVESIAKNVCDATHAKVV